MSKDWRGIQQNVANTRTELVHRICYSGSQFLHDNQKLLTEVLRESNRALDVLDEIVDGSWWARVKWEVYGLNSAIRLYQIEKELQLRG